MLKWRFSMIWYKPQVTKCNVKDQVSGRPYYCSGKNGSEIIFVGIPLHIGILMGEIEKQMFKEKKKNILGLHQ